MSLNPIHYFRDFRIEKIRYLLQPQRAVLRGCLYSFVKFCVAWIAFFLPAQILIPMLQTLNPAFENNPQPLLAYSAFAIIGIAGFCCSIIGMNILDSIWRKKEKAEDDAAGLDLRHVLESILGTAALSGYNKEVVQRILRIGGDLDEQLPAMSGKQRALIEDGILYYYETNNIPHAHAYGMKIMIAGMYILFFLMFVPLYEFAEHLLYSANPNYRGSPAVLYIFFFVAFIAAGFAFYDIARYWNRLGPHGRNIARNAVFYWPVTFPLLLGLIMWMRDLPAG